MSTDDQNYSSGVLSRQGLSTELLSIETDPKEIRLRCLEAACLLNQGAAPLYIGTRNILEQAERFRRWIEQE